MDIALMVLVVNVGMFTLATTAIRIARRDPTQWIVRLLVWLTRDGLEGFQFAFGFLSVELALVLLFAGLTG